MKNATSRRTFLKKLLGASVATATAGSFAAPAIATEPTFEWKMAMTWPKVLPGLGTGAVRLAKRITAMSGGRLTVKPYGSGELVPAFELFDAVAEGSVEIGHSAPYYWLSKNRSCAFFCAVPGGMTAQEINAWIYYGGGMKLWHELYAEFGLVAFPAGNTGTQMGGWFKKPLETLSDLQGLKMRIPGIAGEIFGKLGGVPETIPGSDLFTYLQSGRIDALEWVGPWNDMALGFHKAATHYYGPGFHEGGPCLELMINKQAFESLPRDLQQLVKVACATENMLMESEYYAGNIRAMQDLKTNHPEITIAPYPIEIQTEFFKLAEEVVADTQHIGDINKRIYESYSNFRKGSMDMLPVMEQGFIKGRYLTGVALPKTDSC